MTAEPRPDSATSTVKVDLPSVSLDRELAIGFAHCSGEAQMLEYAIKTAIAKDVNVFADEAMKVSFLEILDRVTLGQAKDIATGTSGQKEIAACVGFFNLVKMIWKRPEGDLVALLKDTVHRRNRLAHQLLGEVLTGRLLASDALAFLKASSVQFLDVRHLILKADKLSEQFGSVGSDGDSRTRFKTTS